MAKSIDWMYDRKSCNTCKKSRAYFDAHDCSIAIRVDAVKERKGPTEALELAKQVEKIVVVRPKSIVHFEMKSSPPDDATLLAHLIGPTGNLRAPTLIVGKTMVVGFHEDAYRSVLGS